MIAANGQVIGEIAAAFLDTDSWRVESLHIKLRKEVAGELGATRNILHAGTLDVPIRIIQSVGDAVVLSVTTDILREFLPGVGSASSGH